MELEPAVVAPAKIPTMICPPLHVADHEILSRPCFRDSKPGAELPVLLDRVGAATCFEVGHCTLKCVTSMWQIIHGERDK